MHAPLWMASLPVLNATIFEGVFAKNLFLTQGRAGAGEDEQPRLPSIPVIPGHNKTVCCLFWPPVPQLLVAWLAFAIWPVVQPTPSLFFSFLPCFGRQLLPRQRHALCQKPSLASTTPLPLRNRLASPNPSPVAAIARRRASSVAGSERGPSVSGGSRRRRAGSLITPLEERRSPLPRFPRLRRLT